MSDRNPPSMNEGCADRVAELAAMRRLAEAGIHVRSSRQVRRGDFRDLPWVGDPPAPGVISPEVVEQATSTGTSEQLELFGDEQ